MGEHCTPPWLLEFDVGVKHLVALFLCVLNSATQYHSQVRISEAVLDRFRQFLSVVLSPLTENEVLGLLAFKVIERKGVIGKHFGKFIHVQHNILQFLFPGECLILAKRLVQFGFKFTHIWLNVAVSATAVTIVLKVTDVLLRSQEHVLMYFPVLLLFCDIRKV